MRIGELQTDFIADTAAQVAHSLSARPGTSMRAQFCGDASWPRKAVPPVPMHPCSAPKPYHRQRAPRDSDQSHVNTAPFSRARFPSLRGCGSFPIRATSAHVPYMYSRPRNQPSMGEYTPPLMPCAAPIIPPQVYPQPHPPPCTKTLVCMLFGDT